MGRKGGSYSFEKRRKELAKKKKKADKIAKRQAKNGGELDDDISPIDPAELGLAPAEPADEAADDHDEEEDEPTSAFGTG